MRLRRLALLFIFGVSTFLHGAPADLLLIASDDVTLRPVLKQLIKPQVETHAAWTLWRGDYQGKSIVLARTDGDPLNAVAATTLAIRRHQPRLIVVYGNARAHDPSLLSGDVVLSARFAAFDGLISPVRALGDGSNSLEWNKLPYLLITAGEKETRTESFPASASALQLAQTLKPARGRVVIGVLGSAHQTNREADRIARIREQWGTSAEDAESAHVAGCAALFGVPVIGIRVIDGASDEAASFALQFIEAWK